MTNLLGDAAPQSTEPTELTARQQEVLERAFELVVEGGLASLTMKKVAERIGFTEAALYRHYPSKQALVRGLFEFVQSRLLPTIRVIAADSNAPAIVRLERMVRHHVRVLRDTQGMPMLFLAEGVATGDDELLERMGAVMGEYRGHLIATLREIDGPGMPPAELRVMLMMGLPAAYAISCRAMPRLAPPEGAMDSLVRYYVRALSQPVAADAEEER